MSEALRGIPGLYWVAFAFLGLGWWVDDIFGIVIAIACMVVGTLQLMRKPAGSPGAAGPDGPGGSDVPRPPNGSGEQD